MRRLLRISSVCLLLGAVAPLAASAQDYPNRTIRVIVTTAPGGISDVFLRSITDQLHQRLGQPVIVENRPGGNMIIGARACAEAAPDGYTFCVMPGEPLTYNQFQFKAIPYDPEASFATITNFFFLTQALGVTATLPAKNLDELAKLSKDKPGTLSYSAPSSSLIVFMEKWKQQTGADLVRVPFKGGGDTVTNMLNNTTPIGFLASGISCRTSAPEPSGRCWWKATSARRSFPRRRAFRKSISMATTRARSSACWRPPVRRGRSSTRCAGMSWPS